MKSYLFRQNQFPGASDAQAIDLTAVSNQDFCVPGQELFGVNQTRLNRRIRLISGDIRCFFW